MDEVTPEDFRILREACDALDTAHVPYVIGGGTVVVLYGRQRRTKDFDIFLHRKYLRRAMDALSLANFTTTDTEKKWLYKAWRGETLVDLIVESRGGMHIDDEVIRRSRIVEQHGHPFRVMGPEDTLIRKILTLTEGRPDWYDAISIVERQRGQFDWGYILERAEGNLRRVLSFFLFAQTELHRPPHSPHSGSDNFLYRGDAPGPIPQWVVFRLVQRIWLSHERPAPLRALPQAA